MDSLKDIKEWMRRSSGNLARAEAGKMEDRFLFEDLCYDAQQTAEKALKALCISLNISFPWTHSIAELLTLLENNGVDIPEIVKEAEILTVYATDTRYPGDWEPVEEEEYVEALRHAKTIFDWVSEKLKNLLKETDLNI